LGIGGVVEFHFLFVTFIGGKEEVGKKGCEFHRGNGFNLIASNIYIF